MTPLAPDLTPRLLVLLVLLMLLLLVLLLLLLLLLLLRKMSSTMMMMPLLTCRHSHRHQHWHQRHHRRHHHPTTRSRSCSDVIQGCIDLVKSMMMLLYHVSFGCSLRIRFASELQVSFENLRDRLANRTMTH